MTLDRVVNDIADCVVEIDSSRIPHSQFQPGVGPYGEPQLVKGIANKLDCREAYRGLVITKRKPDLLIKGVWAVEFKIARPFGDNGKPAENWSVNLLHPYSGNTSLLGDCMKLAELDGFERKAALVIGYEHTPPQIDLGVLFESYELIARQILSIDLGERVTAFRKGLVHPVHQQLTVLGWEVFSRRS